MIAWIVLALATPGPPPVVTVSSPRVFLSAGERGEAAILARIEEGFRIQANPASDPFLVPARLEIEADDHVEAGAPAYPPGEPYRLEGAAEDLSVYRGEVLIRLPLVARRAPGEAGGERLLRGRLHYQACNARMCLRPSSVPVEVWVIVRPSPAPR